MNSAECLRDLQDVATPSLVVLRERLEHNIAAMAAAGRRAGKKLRPHAKTHKCVEIARLQLAAGATGICCATLDELDAMAAAGVPNLLLTAPNADAVAMRELAELHRRTRVAIVCDSTRQLDLLESFRRADDPILPVHVDLDVGQKRTGVADTASGVALAKSINARDGFSFAGLQGFAGQVQHIVDAEGRQAAAKAVGEALRALQQAIEAAGIACPEITGSGTGAFAFDAADIYSELQVGSYVFMDADYARLRHATPLPFQTSLFVMATVVSANQPDQVTIDAGAKAFAFNGPPPNLILGAPEGATYRFAGDEHGVLELPPSAEKPALGSRLLLSATHCDPTVNLHPVLHAWKAGEAFQKWPVVGRYRR